MGETTESAAAGKVDEALDAWLADARRAARDPEAAAGKRQTKELDDGAALGVAIFHPGTEEGPARVRLATDASGDLRLHWGVAVQDPGEWRPAPEAMRPPGSKPFDERALRSPFRTEDGLQALEIELGPIDGKRPRAINFVIYDAAGDRWLKENGDDIHFALPRPPRPDASAVDELVERIAEAEVGDHSWTLMHRFHLCREMLEEAGDDPEALSLLFVWLRFSAIRQLPWQRKYNTKPRELAHAQEKLTAAIADRYREGTEAAIHLRHMLSTVGRGGEGQRVRDQILEIMHAHHIKELGGTWLEQWHQKLHNNTTPDDIGICRAYLAFLRAEGDVTAYDRALEAEGLTRARLASFERPITGDPDDYPDRRDGLIEDFEAFLRLLKSVHAGEDLETAADAASDLLDGDEAAELHALVRAGADDWRSLAALAERMRAARARVAERRRAAASPEAVRELLYVDIGLEAALRRAFERLGTRPGELDAAIALAEPVCAHLEASGWNGELDAAAAHWRALRAASGDGALRLHAVAAAERTGRAVREATDAMRDRLQPKADRLGAALGVEEWTLPIFGEEVARGTLLFVASRLLARLDPLAREAAGVGGWQPIGPGDATGRLHVVEALRQIQETRFAEPTVILASRVDGDEEIPAGVRAVLTPSIPDLVSHVAVRARNEGVVVAGNLGSEEIERLERRAGEIIRVHPGAEPPWSPASEAEQAAAAPSGQGRGAPPALREPRLEAAVLRPAEMADDRVGGKGRGLCALAESELADAFVPPFFALAFGTFEAVLADPANDEVAARYRQRRERIGERPAEDELAALRAVVRELAPPAWLASAVKERAAELGVPLPDDFGAAWDAIARVWASAWTPRAAWARRRLRIDDSALRMAVVIQRVVAADYGFVLHTADPATGDRGTVYGELVLGLGETLVANEPGGALAFAGGKGGGEPQVRGMPSKSFGLYGGGAIARSDSNGEDLAGYAGAGLYESVPVTAPRRLRLDYAADPLLWDRERLDRLLGRLIRLGETIESAFGGPQDIEGAVAGDELYVVQARPQV